MLFGIVVAKSGQAVVSETVCTAEVNMLVNGNKQPAVVNDTPYVPELQGNLNSVRRLQDTEMPENKPKRKMNESSSSWSTVCVGFISNLDSKTSKSLVVRYTDYHI